jgi:hypothetical protein
MKKRDIIEISIIGVLIIVLLLAVISGTRRRRIKPPKGEPKGTILQQETLREKGVGGEVSAQDYKIEDKQLFSSLEQEAKDLELIRDPFTSTLITPIEDSSFRLYLSGILWDEKDPTAIINDRIVGIGDRFGVYSVVNIKQDRVILNDGFSDFELRLKQ